MRTMRAAVALGAVALLLGACDDLTTPSENPQQDLLQRIEALGFRTDGVVDMGDYVVVEGDIRLSKQQLLSGPAPRPSDGMGPLFQYRTNALVSSPRVQQIRVAFSNLDGGWQSAARQAMDHWSRISGSYVNMVLVTSPSREITVRSPSTCLPANVAAVASFPSAGYPGSTIDVNPCFFQPLTAAQMLHNMVHEFGHTIGFRHSNYASLGETAGTLGAVRIPGTPTSDAGSVMNGGTALNSWAGFSTYDRLATRTLYPLPAPVVTSTSPGIITLNWGFLPGASYYQVRLVEVNWVQDVDTGSSETRYEGGWGTVYGTSVSTAREWTGNSTCMVYETAYRAEGWTYFWEVKAIFPNGTGPTTVHYAEIC
jgi:Dual-action HEIGH metallo-peptidase